MEERISLEKAITLISNSISAIGTERVPVTSAHNRILAEDIKAPISQPPFNRSPLDGYAFKAKDSKGASGETPCTLKVVETLYAGDWSDSIIEDGQAVRIMTGAPIPQGCDCVLGQENTERNADDVRIFSELKEYENFCWAGEDYKQGDTIIPEGIRLNSTAFGVLASAGLFRPDFQVNVRRQLKCALLCTGDELVDDCTKPLPAGKIYSSNEAMLHTRLLELGLEVITTAKSWGDDAEELAQAMKEAAKSADVVITTGGVSVGEKDILHNALPLMGADRVFWRVMLKPGTPAMYSLYEGTPVLSLSGNPFAAMATFELLARPVFAALSGSIEYLPQGATGVLDTPFRKSGKVRRFIRGTYRDGHVTLPQGQSSGQLCSAVGSNCLVEIISGQGPLEVGDAVSVLLL